MDNVQNTHKPIDLRVFSIIVAAVIVFGVGIFFVYKSLPTSKKNSNADVHHTTIDSASAAVTAADKNATVQNFKQHYSGKEFEIRSYATYNTDTPKWIVVYYAVNAADVNLEIDLAPDGTVLRTASEGG